MSFEWACFISYRHGQGELIKEFIDELETALQNHLGLAGSGLKVFVDRERLKPSYSVNPALAEAICKSVCMIVVYNHGYFDKNSPFCAKEFCAMVELEKERLGTGLGKSTLIIPIMLRPPERIPAEILDRNPCDFSKIYTNPEERERILKLKKRLNQSSLEIAYPKDIERIVAVIMDTYHILTSQDGDICGECSHFEFPDDSEVDKLLHKTAYLPVFPTGVAKP